MSFRELKNFSEIMKSVGYPRLISIDNFRLPNFELVADILYWMVHRIDETADISDDISTENKRVKFLTSVATSISQTIQIRLKLKFLYRGDGYAVKELLKIAKFLYKAQKMSIDEKIEGIDEIEQSNLLNNLRNSQNMGSLIVETGSKLDSLLGTEKYIKYDREQILLFLDKMSHNIENNLISKEIEKLIINKISIINNDINVMLSNISQLKCDISSLNKKIDRKESEYQRLLKRLNSLKNVKPSFINEYINLENSHKLLYKLYIIKYRNFHFLETKFDKYRKYEIEKNNQHKKKLKIVQKKLRQQELQMLRGNADIINNNNNNNINNHDITHENDNNTFEGLVDDIPSSGDSRVRPHGSHRSRRSNNSGSSNERMVVGSRSRRQENDINNDGISTENENSPLSGTSTDIDSQSTKSEDTQSNLNNDENDGTRSLTNDSLGSLSDLNF